jgi:hypothetical protein
MVADAPNKFDALVDAEGRRSTAPYVLFGFCVLAAYAAQRFLGAMLGHLPKEVEETKRRLARVEETAKAAADSAASAMIMTDSLFKGITERPLTGSPTAQTEDVVLTTDQYAVLVALRGDDRLQPQTVRTISQRTGMPATDILTVLARLTACGFAVKHTHPDGDYWGLTSEGSNYVPPSA